MNRIFLLLLASLLPVVCAAAPPDVALVHFDKSFYVSGEVVWYKLYLPASAQGKDFSVRLTVVNTNGSPAVETFLAVEKKAVCHGYLALPFDARASVYTFIFSATQKNGTEVELLRANVPVYNDLNPMIETGEPEPVLEEDSVIPPNDLKVLVQLVSSGKPSPRQTVQLKISVTDQIGNPVTAEGSLSVTDDELCGGKVLAPGNLQMGANFPNDADWLAGVYKSGFVRDVDGRLLTAAFIPVLDLETQQLHIAKSTSGGFTLQLPAYTGVRRLQMLGVPETPLLVSWEEKDDFIKSSQKLRYTEGLLHYLDLSRKRKKIYQFYGRTETELNIQAFENKPIEWKGKQLYKVQNFERFPDLATFFQEVIWRVKFVKRGERYSAKMYNVDLHADFEEPPLFLLDQKASYDADFIARLDPAAIESIELLFEPKLLRKLYPAIGGGGVVRIKTLSGNHPLPTKKESEILSLQGISRPAIFPNPAPNAVEPLLRPVVFWQPSFTTDKNGTVTIPFVQSDDHSTFCAEVLVQGPDGRRGYARFCYKVE